MIKIPTSDEVEAIEKSIKAIHEYLGVREIPQVMPKGFKFVLVPIDRNTHPRQIVTIETDKTSTGKP